MFRRFRMKWQKCAIMCHFMLVLHTVAQPSGHPKRRRLLGVGHAKWEPIIWKVICKWRRMVWFWLTMMRTCVVQPTSKTSSRMRFPRFVKTFIAASATLMARNILAKLILKHNTSAMHTTSVPTTPCLIIMQSCWCWMLEDGLMMPIKSSNVMLLQHKAMAALTIVWAILASFMRMVSMFLPCKIKSIMQWVRSSTAMLMGAVCSPIRLKVNMPTWPCSRFMMQQRPLWNAMTHRLWAARQANTWTLWNIVSAIRMVLPPMSTTILTVETAQVSIPSSKNRGLILRISRFVCTTSWMIGVGTSSHNLLLPTLLSMYMVR